MSPKHEKYVWSSGLSKKKFEERHSHREKHGLPLLPLKIPEDDGKVFRPPEKSFKKAVSPAGQEQSNSELSIEPVDSDEEDENVDRYDIQQMTPRTDLPGQVSKPKPNSEILELDEIEPGKPKEQPSDVVSTAASTPALQPETEHFPPETVHPAPNRPQEANQRPSMQSMASVQTLGDSTHVEIGRMATHNLSNLGRNLGWDGQNHMQQSLSQKDQAVKAKLARGKSMTEILQVTDQELEGQDVFENDTIGEPYASSNVLVGASPIANTIRNVRRMSKGACDFHLPAISGPRVSISEQGSNQGNEVTDLEQNQPLPKSANHLMPPPQGYRNPRPSITRTRTPSKQRPDLVDSSEEQAMAPRTSLQSATGGEAPPKAHNPGTGSQHAAIMVWLGILIDAVPESLVIGILVNKSTTREDETAAAAALPFVISVFLSNLPEAMSSSGSMKAHGMRVSSILLMWFVTTFLTAIGALIGAVAFPPSTIQDESTTLVVSGVEGLAAGAMLTMIAQTMMPEAFEQGGDIVGLSCLAGFLCAMTVKLIPV